MQKRLLASVFPGVAVQHDGVLTEPAKFPRELANSFYAQRDLIEVLFQGSQSAVLPMRIERELRSYLHRQFPKAGRELDMRLTYQILGSYYVFQQYGREYGMEETMAFVVGIAEMLTEGAVS